MTPLLLAMRPRQWSKNLIIFGGLIFSGEFKNSESVSAALMIFAAFCLVSSAGYLLNDVIDKESDALHPEKRTRPIASGRVSVTSALAAAIVLLLGGLAIAAPLPYGLVAIGAYVVNQLFYTFLARGTPVLDVFIISAGFLIRAVAGAAVLLVTISPWLLVCTFVLALFLGFCKRKHELDLRTDSRASLAGYSAPLLDQFIGITAASTVIAYSVYAIQSKTASEHQLLVATIPFPVFGVFRYLQLVYSKQDGGNPDRALVRDPWMLATVLLWIILSIYAISTKGRISL